MNEVWNDPNSIWKTQPAFFSYLRGNLRRLWVRYPVSTKFKTSMCRPNKGSGRARFVGNCSQCGVVRAKSHLEVDHIIPCGKLSTWDDVGPFLKRMITGSDNMRLVCHPCHKIITMQERFGIGTEEALIHSKVVEFSKKAPHVQKEILLKAGYDGIHVKNAKVRRTNYHIHLSHKSGLVL